MKRERYTMTIEQVCGLFRDHGIPMENRRLADMLEAGEYPFGRMVRKSPSGRRTFEIWRCDVEDFLRTKSVNI